MQTYYVRTRSEEPIFKCGRTLTHEPHSCGHLQKIYLLDKAQEGREVGLIALVEQSKGAKFWSSVLLTKVLGGIWRIDAVQLECVHGRKLIKNGLQDRQREGSKSRTNFECIFPGFQM